MQERRAQLVVNGRCPAAFSTWSVTFRHATFWAMNALTILKLAPMRGQSRTGSARSGPLWFAKKIS